MSEVRVQCILTCAVAVFNFCELFDLCGYIFFQTKFCTSIRWPYFEIGPQTYQMGPLRSTRRPERGLRPIAFVIWHLLQQLVHSAESSVPPHRSTWCGIAFAVSFRYANFDSKNPLFPHQSLPGIMAGYPEENGAGETYLFSDHSRSKTCSGKVCLARRGELDSPRQEFMSELPLFVTLQIRLKSDTQVQRKERELERLVTVCRQLGKHSFSQLKKQCSLFLLMARDRRVPHAIVQDTCAQRHEGPLDECCGSTT